MNRPALFIDRDGTLIADAHYLADASRVVLLPETGRAVALANATNVPVIIVTNQSGIARGLITEAQYEATRTRTEQLIADAGGTVLGTYHCPHLPSAACRCRKPGTALYERAAADHGLDLAHSAYIGDRWRDAQPALATGGIGILVPGVESPAEDVEMARSSASPRIHVMESLLHAVQLALQTLGASPT